jgi:hypothetical protein
VIEEKKTLIMANLLDEQVEAISMSLIELMTASNQETISMN